MGPSENSGPFRTVEQQAGVTASCSGRPLQVGLQRIKPRRLRLSVPPPLVHGPAHMKADANYKKSRSIPTHVRPGASPGQFVDLLSDGRSTSVSLRCLSSNPRPHHLPLSHFCHIISSCGTRSTPVVAFTHKNLQPDAPGTYHSQTHRGRTTARRTGDAARRGPEADHHADRSPPPEADHHANLPCPPYGRRSRPPGLQALTSGSRERSPSDPGAEPRGPRPRPPAQGLLAPPGP
ncbi:unnamed protein product [Boreogadus saida]